MKPVDLPSDKQDTILRIVLLIGKAKNWQVLRIYRLFKQLRKSL